MEQSVSVLGSPYSEQLPFALSPEAFAFGAFAIRVIRDSRDSIRTSQIAVSQSGIRTSGGIREEAFARHSHSGVFRIRGNRPSRYSRISRQIATHCLSVPAVCLVLVCWWSHSPSLGVCLVSTVP